MIKVGLLMTGHNSYITRMSIKEPQLSKKYGILILGSKTIVSPEFIYIGYPKDCAAAISQCKAPVTFFSAGDSPELGSTNCEAVNLIVTNIDLFELHNIISINYSKFIEWNELFFSSANSSEGMRSLFNQIEEKKHCVHCKKTVYAPQHRYLQDKTNQGIDWAFT